MYYVPISSVKRVYKRIAMSRGGFTGKGIFAAIPYLIVEYDDGQEKQCIFKVEEMVDQMISCIHERWPKISVHSVQAQKKLEEKQRALELKQEKMEKSKARETIRQLQNAQAYLERKPALYVQLSSAAHKKRVQEQTNPAYRWAALAIVLMGAVSFVYGAYALINHLGSAMYFLLFGLAAIFLFSGTRVLPTRKNNAAYVQGVLAKAQKEMESYTAGYPEFPVPPYYAHPAVLQRMEEIIADERAADIGDALEVLKKDLQALNSSVTVEQEEYDEIMAIKPLFLVMDYT